MLTSLAFVLLGGLLMATVAEKIGLPRIIGMLLAGVLLGPHLLNAFEPALLDNSADLRKMALIIILLKAGLTLDLSDLKQVGRPAVLMSFLPATIEIIGYLLIAPWLLGISLIDAAVMGAVMAAVSPAVVVPRMIHLIEQKIGTNQKIPQLILAGASCDDIVVIILFTAFLSMAQGGAIHYQDFFNIPISIIAGVGLGVLTGWLLLLFFKWAHTNIGLTEIQKVIIMLAISFILVAIEKWLANTIAISGLLAVMSMASVIKMRGPIPQSTKLSKQFGNIWIASELLLFVLVGAAVDIRYLSIAGFKAILTILLALIFRSLGVYLSLLGTKLSAKEKVFCIFAYLPKATVQAAIGAIPLAVGLNTGPLILSVAVIGITITAPLGALLIDRTQLTLLSQDNLID
ncbi:cation:proton antiporter [Globicatella sanguinis]